MAKLLLVEDDDAVRATLCEALELEGYAADCVANCAEAEAALARGAYTLLISDVRLPDGSGRDLAHKAIAAGANVILLSGHPDEIRGMAPGRIAGVAKPFRLDDLMQAVARQMPE
jgi:DNA-binding response OmpR family regulator